MADPLLKFEHAVLARVRDARPGRRWLVAASGGVDSMVLAEFARRWRRHLCDDLIIAHVHHGPGPNAAFRDRAQGFVAAWAHAHGLPFVTNSESELAPDDEASLRRRRYRHLAEWRDQIGCDHVVLGHHRDDLIETRLIRLIRGTGPAGLGAMRTRAADRLRPLLGASRAEIEAYARGRDLRWIDDPTNAHVSALRNWIRHEWLPALRTRQPGADRALARSLELVSAPRPARSDLGRVTGVRRDAWRELAPDARAQVTRDYLHALGARDFGRAHVNEILKRLESARAAFSFEMIGLVFSVTREQWWASPRL